MRKIIIVVAALVVGSSLAWAAPLNFDDAEFDYSDSGIDTAYVSLAKNDTGGLDISFTSEEPEAAVATVNVEDQVRGYDEDGDNAYSEEQFYVVNPDAATTFEDVELQYVGLEFERVILLHEEQNFEAVKEAYFSQLEQLGFTLTPEREEANLEVYTMESGGETVRLFLTNQGNDTQVSFIKMSTAPNSASGQFSFATSNLHITCTERMQRRGTLDAMKPKVLPSTPLYPLMFQSHGQLQSTGQQGSLSYLRTMTLERTLSV
jgi:hypothetical protein